MASDSSRGLDSPEMTDAARRRVIWTSLATALVMVPLGLVLAQQAQYEWTGEAGRGAYPSIWSAVFPRAAIGAFSFPYLLIALMALVRARATGWATKLVVWLVGVPSLFLVLLASLRGIPVIVWALVDAVSGNPNAISFALAQRGLLVALAVLQRRLVRDGALLQATWRRKSLGAVPPEGIASVLIVAYIIVWIVSLVAPDAIHQRRIARAAEVRAAAVAAERTRIPVGVPLVLAWRVRADARPAAHDPNVPADVAVGLNETIYISLVESTIAITSGGRVLWKNEAVRQRDSEALPNRDGLVYVGGGDGTVYALRAADGTVAWRTPLMPQTATSYAASSLALSSDGGVYASRSQSVGPAIVSVCA